MLYGAGSNSVLLFLCFVPTPLEKFNVVVHLFFLINICCKNGMEQCFSKSIVVRSVFCHRWSQISCEHKRTFQTTIGCKRQLFTGSPQPRSFHFLEGTFPLARNSSPRYESRSRAVLSIFKFLKINCYAICYLTPTFCDCL